MLRPIAGEVLAFRAEFGGTLRQANLDRLSATLELEEPALLSVQATAVRRNRCRSTVGN
jgi:hypothetical protein